MRLPPKDPAELKLVRFVFAADLEHGVTIAGAALAIAVTAGSDAGAAAVLDGAALVDNAALAVLQRVALGLAGCDYEIRCLVTDSSGLKHLVAATLPVRDMH
ncbi:MAG: hypothetical protein HS128_19240 [Ideonella sp.]|nr:hypothetical protein [Ideonella sp.]MCC7455974.1 hypothetical protein [Nitrospira sp.]